MANTEKERGLTMATSSKGKTPANTGFDVTAVIGRVEFGGDLHPHVAAFQLIAEHHSPGTFSFPGENGPVTVDVDGENYGGPNLASFGRNNNDDDRDF